MKELHLRNIQHVRTLSIDRLRRAARVLLDELLEVESYELAIHFIGPRKMAAMNQHYLDHQGSTDVITFDYRDGFGAESQVAGEIYISVQDAVQQAKVFRRPWNEELIRYIVHGILHLLGHDDLEPKARRLMKRAENRLLRKTIERL